MMLYALSYPLSSAVQARQKIGLRSGYLYDVRIRVARDFTTPAVRVD
jgi:hypothetical protein